ncbi:MAG: protease pro-enzyme activation domain-containing protein, partial [Rhodanobacteraceae bacterium]
MGVDVVVQSQNAQGLIRYAQMASDPSSPMYRHFLTPQEVGDRYGATLRDYTDAAQYFARHGLHVGGWPQRQALFVAGTQAALESAFGTTFGLYEKNGQKFVAPMSQPHFAQVLPVTGVAHLVTARTMHTYNIPVRAGNGTFAGYSPQQIQNAFDYSGAYKAGFDGTGITVGIIGTGGISAKDVPFYGKLFGARVATVTEAPVTDSGEAAGLAQAGVPTPNPNPSASPQAPYAYSDPGLATPPPVTPPCGTPPYASILPTATCNPEDGEAQLDTEQIAALAPGSAVSFYLAFNPADCAGANSGACNAVNPGAIGVQGLFIADDEIAQAIADNTSDSVSLSYGGGEVDDVGLVFDGNGVGYEPMEFAALAAEGIAVFVSSGDTGAEECSNAGAPCVSYPSGDPNVTSVGGITASLNSFGQPTSQFTAWGYQTHGGFSGSGGG